MHVCRRTRKFVEQVIDFHIAGVRGHRHVAAAMAYFSCRGMSRLEFEPEVAAEAFLAHKAGRAASLSLPTPTAHWCADSVRRRNKRGLVEELPRAVAQEGADCASK
jgi:hypothetical protein